MGKFSIECPKCGSINQASTFVFAKKVIQCGSCKEEINVKNARLVSKQCPDCGSIFVCDQAKLEGKKCPICGKPVTRLTATAEYKIETLNCPRCACAIEVDKSKSKAVCPICDCEIDIQNELAKSKLVGDGGISVIQYEGDNTTFIWKHPIEDFNIGSQLIVHESQEAVFLLNGEALDTFGPGRHALETESIPLIKKVCGWPAGHQSPFHAEVYFINKSVQMGMKWGTDSRVRFTDPKTGIYLDIGASGEFNLRVSNSRKLLIKLVGTTRGIDWEGKGRGFTRSLQDCFKAPLITEVKSYLASVIKEEQINIFEIDSYLSKLSAELKKRISPKFEEYGLDIPEFYVGNVSLPEDDKNFKDLRALNAHAYIDIQAEKVRKDIAVASGDRQIYEAQTQAQLEMIKMQTEANRIRTKGMAEADVMAAKGYSQKDLIDADVQIKTTESISHMGSGGGSGGGSGAGGVANDMFTMMAGMKMAGMMVDKLDEAMTPNKAAAATQPTAPNIAVPSSADIGDIWDCACGAKGIKSKFCPECGRQKPEAWNCSCGARDIKSKFCPECGAKKPE